MKPLFSLLGMNLIAKNMAMGSFGTVQSSLAGEGVYGKADVVLWDSGITEGAMTYQDPGKLWRRDGWQKDGKEVEKQGLIDLFWRSWDEPPHMILAQGSGCGERGNICNSFGEVSAKNMKITRTPNSVTVSNVISTSFACRLVHSSLSARDQDGGRHRPAQGLGWGPAADQGRFARDEAAEVRGLCELRRRHHPQGVLQESEVRGRVLAGARRRDQAEP